MHGLVPIFYIHVSVSDLYIPTIKHNSLLQEREKKEKMTVPTGHLEMLHSGMGLIGESVLVKYLMLRLSELNRMRTCENMRRGEGELKVGSAELSLAGNAHRVCMNYRNEPPRIL